MSADDPRAPAGPARPAGGATGAAGRSGSREGNLEAPKRHAIDWRNPEFYDEAALTKELERVFEICHGCRRCFSLCNAFPTLFDLIDATETGEVGSVDKRKFPEVVDHCYLCDLCFMTKCPYVPPHPWNVDFPHLMLRAKAVHTQREGVGLRDRVLAATDAVGQIAGIPVVASVVNAVNRSSVGRALLASTLGVDRGAPVPAYHARTARKRLGKSRRVAAATQVPEAQATPATRGRVALFTTCYGNRNEPRLAEDLAAVFEHNAIPVRLPARERCCGMPRLELGDLAAVERLARENIPELKRLVDAGYDIVAPIPSCVLMFKQELPLLFPGDPDVEAVRARTFDPFEYLMLRHREGLLRTDFKSSLGKVSYHVPCHLRVQNIGLKTRDILRLVPGTTVEVIERCSGHDGTYGVKREFRAASVKIGTPVAARVAKAGADHYSSDCPMAGRQLESLLGAAGAKEASGAGAAEGPHAGRATTPHGPEHPLALLRIAYGI